MLKHKIMAHYIVADLTERNAPDDIFSETEKHGLEVDWLINNAGVGSAGDFATLDAGHELAMIDLNIAALVALTHRYLAPMRERGHGTIINVSSAASFQPIPFMATYAATKAFVSSFSEAIAEENRPYGIRVLTLCPGSTETNFFAASGIDRPIKVKGQQRSEQVVETALKALKSGKSVAVSGFTNLVGALLGRHVPHTITTRAVGKALRGRYQKAEE